MKNCECDCSTGGVRDVTYQIPQDLRDLFAEGTVFLLEESGNIQITEPGGDTWITGEPQAKKVETEAHKASRWYEKETERHPNSAAYHERLQKWGDLHDSKQKDYGSDADPFANIRQGAREIGLPPWIGCAIRMRDKMVRILTAARQYIETGEVSMANEALVDSFDDLGVYSGIGAVLLEEES